MTSLQAEYERELSAARLEKQALLGQVSGLQDDLERISSRDEQLRAELQQRFDQLQAEREAANQELVALRSSLAEANSRQELADTRVDSLELRLREQQQEHDAALQQALVRERRQARRLTAALMVAAAAFVLGIAGSVINFWEVRNTTRLLAEVSQGISQIRITMEGRSAGTMPAPSPWWRRRSLSMNARRRSCPNPCRTVPKVRRRSRPLPNRDYPAGSFPRPWTATRSICTW